MSQNISLFIDLLNYFGIINYIFSKTNPSTLTPKNDPYNLSSRYCAEQEHDFSRALSEIRNGQKRSCWMWYCLPTAPWVVNGTERGSSINKRYALRDLSPHNHRGTDAARAYLRYIDQDKGVNLRTNYLALVIAIAEQLEKGISNCQLMGILDAPKLVSSLELFQSVSCDGFDDDVYNACTSALVVLKRVEGAASSRSSAKTSKEEEERRKNDKDKDRKVTDYFQKTLPPSEKKEET